MTVPLGAALRYAEDGRAVFPLRPAGKLPETARGLNDATTDQELLAYWWERWLPKKQAGTCGPNIGIRTGAASGLVVIDIDAKHGVDGFASWTALLTELDVPFHETREVCTPAGGFHLYYVHPGVEIANKAGLRPGVDVRGDGGYVVAPPSFVVTDDGAFGHYEVTKDVPVAPLPAALVNLLVPPPPPEPGRYDRLEAALRLPEGKGRDAYARKALEGESERVRSSVNGTRNDTLVRAAFRLGQLVGAGLLDVSTVAEELAAAAIGAGLSNGEAVKTIASGLNAGASHPRSAPS